MSNPNDTIRISVDSYGYVHVEMRVDAAIIDAKLGIDTARFISKEISEACDRAEKIVKKE